MPWRTIKTMSYETKGKRRGSDDSENKPIWPWVLIGTGAAAVLAVVFWPKKSAASPAPSLPQAPSGGGNGAGPTAAPAAPPYVPSPVATGIGMTYTIQPTDTGGLSQIAADQYAGQIDPSTGEVVQNPDQLWLLIWSENEQTIPDPNYITPGEQITISPLSSFTPDQIAQARRYYNDWQAYGPT